MTDWVWPKEDHGELFSRTWHSALWLRTDGPVMSKSNHRMYTTTSAGKSWKDLKIFQDSLTARFRFVRPGTWLEFSNTVSLNERPVLVAAILARTKLDAGNVSKTILDATEGVLVCNDAEIVAVTEIVQRATKQQGAIIGVAQLSPKASTFEQLSALNTLVEQLVQICNS